MLVLAIEAQPGMPRTYKIFVDGKVRHERHTLEHALVDLVDKLDEKLKAETNGRLSAKIGE